jgi:hypothetical protein
MIALPFALVGAAAGAVILRRRRVLVIPLLAPIACVLVTVAVFYAATRFRATAEGPIHVLVAVALVALWDRVRRGVTPADGDAHAGGVGGPPGVAASPEGPGEAGTVGPLSRQG